jgi:hypothetical protein
MKGTKLNLYNPAVTTGDKIAQMLLIPAGLRAGSTSSQRRNAHLRWILCSGIALAAYVIAIKKSETVDNLELDIETLQDENTDLQYKVDILNRENRRLNDNLYTDGAAFWDGVAAGESLHKKSA